MWAPPISWGEEMKIDALALLMLVVVALFVASALLGGAWIPSELIWVMLFVAFLALIVSWKVEMNKLCAKIVAMIDKLNGEMSDE